MQRKISLSDLSKVVATYELPEIEPADPEEDSLRYVIQIFRNAEGKYTPRVMRWESFNLMPTYLSDEYRYDENGQPQLYMEECLIRDYSIDWEDIECSSEKETLQCVLDEFENQRLSGEEDEEEEGEPDEENSQEDEE